MSDQRVTLHVEEDGVAVVTLDDPGARNALSCELNDDLVAAVATAVGDPAVRAIIVTAAPPVFSAGGSLDDLLHPRRPLIEMYAGFRSIAEAPVPTIAAVNGPAVGAGVNVALACDVILCSPAARFDPRFLDAGIAPGGGHLWRLRDRIGRQAAAALVLCGESLDGEGAARVGLAWRCVPADDLLDEARRLARRAAGREPELVRRTKAALDATAAITDPTAAVEHELPLQQWSMAQPAYQATLERLRAQIKGR